MIVKTVLADREKMFLEGLELILTSGEQYFYRIVKQCSSSAAILEYIKENEVNLVITDINLGDNENSDFIKQIKSIDKSISICILSSYVADKFVRRSFINGADGYVSKFGDAKELLRALAVVASGKTYLSEGLQMTPARSSKPKQEENNVFLDGIELISKLTKREMQVLQLIAEAKSNREIGAELFISDQTVGVHRKNIMRKLSVHNTNALIKFAYENGLV